MKACFAFGNRSATEEIPRSATSATWDATYDSGPILVRLVLAPLVGGALLSSHMPIQKIFAVLAVFPALFAVCGFTIGRLEQAGKLRAAA
jgi:hypothetical protein